MYDIIGDIHGHYDELHQLLTKLGYEYDPQAHSFANPEGRRAVFIGDYIDKGLQNLKCVSLVRNMVAAGSAHAIMGNHDFNAVQYATPHPDKPGEFIRKHDDKNREQHKTFLAEVEGDAALYADVIEWFRTLPVFLKLGDLHFIHACWDKAAIQSLRELGAITPEGPLTQSGWANSGLKHTAEYAHFETLLKGPEEELGHDLSFHDNYGIERRRGRIIWWNTAPATYGEAFGLTDETPFKDRPYTPDASNRLSSDIREGLKGVALLAFGHYWMKADAPTVLSDRIICVDWSVAKGGHLAAYRYNAGETEFRPAGFAYVKSGHAPRVS